MRSFSMCMNGKQRPVINLYGNEAIIDTGAVIPMVSLSPELLKLAWKAKPLQMNIEIGGIGGKAKGDIYTLFNFQIGDLNFDSLDVFVPNIPDTKYTYLLSATMFYGMQFDFNMIDKNSQTFTVNIPDNVSLHRDFKIKDLNGQLYAQVNGILIQDDYIPIRNVTNYTQSFDKNCKTTKQSIIDIVSSSINDNYEESDDFEK